MEGNGTILGAANFGAQLYTAVTRLRGAYRTPSLAAGLFAQQEYRSQRIAQECPKLTSQKSSPAWAQASGPRLDVHWRSRLSGRVERDQRYYARSPAGGARSDGQFAATADSTRRVALGTYLPLTGMAVRF